MQDIFQSFFLWLLKFAMISAGIFIAARMWTLHRRKRRLARGSETPSARQVSAETQLPWHRDPAVVGLARVLLSLAAGLGCFLLSLLIPPTSGWFWGDSALAVLSAYVSARAWLKSAHRQTLDLAELRELGNVLELAAVFLPETHDLKLALELAAENSGRRSLRRHDRIFESVGMWLSRASAALKDQFDDLTRRADVSADDLRGLADGLHQELSRRARGQAERVSRWSKYPVLLGTLPVVCVLLVAPMTDWMLDRVTAPAVEKSASVTAHRVAGETAQYQPAKPAHTP